MGVDYEGIGSVQAVRQQVASVAAVPPPGRSATTLLPSSELIRQGSGVQRRVRWRTDQNSRPPLFPIRLSDESSPVVLYLTAAWCGPCRFISPVIEELNQKYPHVTTYRVDIDEGSNFQRQSQDN
ncbi:hypothetical protein MLD38_039197 [Melastoma candidum]|uniref:Uncharacterized protein n=1 Tax=Melastoma candidum TaxID=119954 RepID=A0ACB9L214_9MYRT|nr:hypothetical protein MLD38_039197 [Melastoma candidum]